VAGLASRARRICQAGDAARPRQAAMPRGARMLAGLVLVGLLGLVGCDSTQSKNERAKLRATRELASRKPQHVAASNPAVRVTDVSLVRGRRSTAIVVELRNRTAKPLTDVPIAVGARARSGRRVPLNVRRNLDWFQTHVPAIPAGETVTWVFEGRRGATTTGRPFARVGMPASPAISRASSLPAIAAAPAPRTEQRSPATRSASVRVHRERRDRRSASTRVLVENTSNVPQYGLQVYALVRDGRRYVAAGKVAIEHLGTDQRKTVSVPLVGRPRGRSPHVHAIPTIFE
jgi:hypothetical protein